MQANPRTVTALFEAAHRYVVPMFQRHYVWARDEQWEPLWNDIEEKVAAKMRNSHPSPHFLGAVILDSARRTSTRQLPRFLIIDGQQRLTTFQLLFTALRDVANQKGLLPFVRAMNRYLLNPDVEFMDSADEQYKIWPTLVNRETFCKIVTAGSPERVLELFPLKYGQTKSGRQKKFPESRERLVEGYEFFVSMIGAACANHGAIEAISDYLHLVLSVLRDDFTVVEIILGDNDDSQEIFNSLNARGKSLSQSDLLRSYIFMRVEKYESDRDRLYQQYWARFEDSWWDEETRRGNVSSSRLDTLTRNLLSSKVGEAVDVRRVHAAYTDWIKNDRPYSGLEDELKEFVAYGRYFEQLYGRSEGALAIFGRRMLVWETTTVYPLVMYLAAEGSFSDYELSQALTFIESFVVRRAICGHQTRAYNLFFVEVISRLRKASPSLRSLIEQLSIGDAETRRFPTNSEFFSAWKANPVYKRLSSEQMAFIFQRLEAEVRSDRAEDVTIPHISIEHVMPKQWAENYPVAGEFVPKEMIVEWFIGRTLDEKQRYERLLPQIRKRRELIDSIGNLTAVTQPLNSAMKNAGFLDKKQYLRESVLALNRHFDQQPEWDEYAIEQRAEQLFRHAVNIWPGPFGQ